MLPPSSDRKAEPMVVMVADDDDDFRAAIVAALQVDGHSTLEAHDGRELLDLLEQGKDESSLRPDVLLTDVRMPKLSGLGVLETLRSAHWNLPVVVMTALSSETIHKVALQLGAVEVLHKPFDTDALLTALRSATAATELHRAPRH